MKSKNRQFGKGIFFARSPSILIKFLIMCTMSLPRPTAVGPDKNYWRGVKTKNSVSVSYNFKIPLHTIPDDKVKYN